MHTVDKAPIDPTDLEWAKEKLKDVLFNCVLNIKLYQSGICPKLICEMDGLEYSTYNRLIQTLHLK